MLRSTDFAILCYCYDHYTGWFGYSKVALVAVHGLIDIAYQMALTLARTWDSGLPPESQNKNAS